MRALSLTLLALVLTSNATPAASPDHWPTFRGPDHLGTATGAALPAVWNVESGENVRWKTEIPGLGHSSPIVWGDRIFLTTAISAAGEQSLRVGLYGDIKPVDEAAEVEFVVLAIDRASGELLWRQTAHRGVPKVKRHTKASHANSTPVTDGKRVIAMFGSEGLYAYDLDGELLWKKDLGVLDSGFYVAPDAQWGFASSPILHDGKVILQADVQEDSFLAAFDAATGEELWRTARDEVPTWSTPSIAPRGDGFQIVVNGWKHIGGYDPSDGSELWKLVGGGDIPVPTPIVARDVEGVGDLILITSAHGRMRPIYAIEPEATGTIERDGEHVAWWHERLGNYMQTPIVVGELGYFCLDNGVLTIVHLPTGERVHQQRLGGGQTGFTGSPVYGDGKLYFTSEDGDVYVLKPGREPEIVATNELGETFMSTPAITGDRILFRARKTLFAIGLPD